MKEKGIKYYMQSILLLFVLVLSLGVSTSTFAADSYLCVGSKITGFSYDKNIKMCRSITGESHNIYIVERHRNAGNKWGVRKPGESGINYLCNEDFNNFGYLSCDSIGNFRIFKENLVFLNSYREDFCNSMDGNGQLTIEAERNVPYIEIGKCHPL